MAEAPHSAEEMIKALARVAKGVATLCRKGALRSDRIDDSLATMALGRAEVHRFTWVFEKAQQGQLEQLRSSYRDIEDWIGDALDASKGAVPKERHGRISSRCRGALGDLWEFLEFGSFETSGKPDESVARDVLKGKFEGAAAELRDCIGRAAKLPRAAPAADPQQTETNGFAGPEEPPAVEARVSPSALPPGPNIHIAFLAPGVQVDSGEPPGRSAPARKRRTVKKARRGNAKPRGAKAGAKKPSAKRTPAARTKQPAKHTVRRQSAKKKTPDDVWLMKAPKGLHRHTARKLWEAALKLKTFRRVVLQEAAGVGESPTKRFLAFAEGEGKLRTNRSERKTNQEAIVYTVGRG
ncbi:MAG: hypothetical protein ACYTKD_31780 [Planctomycetota bacterium]|jgi:hypothetical protein